MNSQDAAAQALYQSLSSVGRKFVEDVLSSLSAEQRLDSSEIVKSLTASLAQDAQSWADLQQRYYRQHLELWMRLATQNAPGQPEKAKTDRSDRRFQAPEWRELPYFSYLRQAYLLNANWLSEIAESARLDVPTKNKLRFFTRQLIDAAAPANFAPTNPEVLKLASETNGDSLMRGIEHLGADLKKGRISMTDETAFEVGGNIAVTPGTVVYENELIQLIQYQPATDSVYERPLVMVPPCINKYYVLDLQPENSLVRYVVSQGHTVFMVSWRNVTEDMGDINWDQYLENGVIKALQVARDICGVTRVNALGFCVGGTLLASALAVLHARNEPIVANLMLLASMLDFSDTGELSVFVDEAYVNQREQEFAGGGVLHGQQLALTFSSLRANDLIWNYVVNNYLKGRKPPAFDLLYWNSDSTNLPGAMYVYYLRNMYLENNLRKPCRLMMCGMPVDLSCITEPAYIMASREDHIVPWRTAFESTRLLGGPTEFVLAASGHIAGVINPPSANKRNYWINSTPAASPDEWLDGAVQQPGSWWQHWGGWLAERAGEMVAARSEAGNAQHRGIEPAPGSYVRVRCD